MPEQIVTIRKLKYVAPHQCNAQVDDDAKKMP